MAETITTSIPSTQERPLPGTRSHSGHGKPRGEEDPIREALFCLAASEKRLKRSGPLQADEILSLLRAATTHLEDALTARGLGAVSAPQLTGAE